MKYRPILIDARRLRFIAALPTCTNKARACKITKEAAQSAADAGATDVFWALCPAGTSLFPKLESKVRAYGLAQAADGLDWKTDAKALLKLADAHATAFAGPE